MKNVKFDNIFSKCVVRVVKSCKRHLMMKKNMKMKDDLTAAAGKNNLAPIAHTFIGLSFKLIVTFSMP